VPAEFCQLDDMLPDTISVTDTARSRPSPPEAVSFCKVLHKGCIVFHCVPLKLPERSALAHIAGSAMEGRLAHIAELRVQR
jgi:hypothetical protein